MICYTCKHKDACKIVPKALGGPSESCEFYIPKTQYDAEPKSSAKADDGKVKLTLVPRKIIFAIAKIREYGNAKYPEGGPENWKTVSPERYRDATYRHLLAYLDDPYGVDEESGLPHLWHLACNVAFLCELEDEEIRKGMEDACNN